MQSIFSSTENKLQATNQQQVNLCPQKEPHPTWPLKKDRSSLNLAIPTEHSYRTYNYSSQEKKNSTN